MLQPHEKLRKVDLLHMAEVDLGGDFKSAKLFLQMPAASRVDFEFVHQLPELHNVINLYKNVEPNLTPRKAHKL